MKNIFVLFVSAFLFTACKKEKATDVNTIFPNYVHSDSVGTNYIQGTFNGVTISMSNADTTENFNYAYWFARSEGLDELNLIQKNKEGSAEMQIYLTNSEILTRQIPYNLPAAEPAPVQVAQFQFVDLKHQQSAQNTPTDNFDYFGNTYQNMTLVVTSFVDNVIRGTFNGVLTSNTGGKIKVTDGSFKIKIKILENKP